MASLKNSFPHPVLNIHDDVTGEFKTTFYWSCDRYYYYLEAVFNLINTTLHKMIADKTAAFIMNIECADTFYRKTFPLYDLHNKIPIPADQLRNKVNISFYICSKVNLPDYTIEGAHEDYSGLSFKIEDGDILAYGGSAFFIAEKNYELLRAVSSIMQIKRGNFKTGLAKVNYNSDKIILELSTDNYNIYSLYKNEKKLEALFHCSLVLPFLLKALSYIQAKVDDYTIHKWYQVIEKRLDDEALTDKLNDEENHLTIIQKLFGNPFDRLFESIKIIEDENE